MARWGNDVLAVWDFENNQEDEKNNYDLVKVNNPAYKTDIVKYNSYSHQVPSNGNYFKFPDSLKTVLAGLSEWTIEGWMYFSTEGGYHAFLGAPWIQDVGQGSFFGLVGFNANNEHFAVNSGFTTVPLNADNAWRHYSIQHKNGVNKYFKNGVLQATINNGNPFVSHTSAVMIGHTFYTGYQKATDRFDMFIVSSTAREGAQTLPLPVLTAVDPVTGSEAGGTAVTLTGEDFRAGATVTIGGDAATDVVVVSATTITCKTPAKTAGVYDVTVTNTDGGTDTLTDAYTYTRALPDYIFEKNMLSNGNAWLILLEVSFPDGEGGTNVLRLCRNNENITWRSQTWLGFPFGIDGLSQNTGGEMPSLTLSVSNVTREIQAVLEANNGAANTTVELFIINSGHLSETTPSWTGKFAVNGVSVDVENANFTCGLGYPASSRRPMDTWQKYVCPFAYGDIFCAVDSAVKATYPTCNKTLANCEERDNKSRFGAELGIPGGYYA